MEEYYLWEIVTLDKKKKFRIMATWYYIWQEIASKINAIGGYYSAAQLIDEYIHEQDARAT